MIGKQLSQYQAVFLQNFVLQREVERLERELAEERAKNEVR